MFSFINKFYQNVKTNKKEQPSYKFNNNNKNQDLNGFSDSDSFVDITKEQSYGKENGLEDNFKKFNITNFLNTFSKDIFIIIFNSRKNKIDSFNIKEKNLDKPNIFDDQSFNFDIDDLFLDNNIYKNKTDIQKYVIEFYLIKNKNKKKIKELVEKWKFSYKPNNDDEIEHKNIDINFLKNKILLLKKSIISYSRLLPLYQYIINNKENPEYSIDFKFYHNNVKKKGKFLNELTENVSLKNENIFSFKLNVKYYSLKEINRIFNETNTIDIDMETGPKAKSLTFHKSKNYQKNAMNNKINDINDIQNEIQTCQTTINNKIINELDSNIESSPLTLNFYDYNKEEENNNNDISLIFDKPIENKQNKYNFATKRKYSLFSNSYETTEDCTPRTSDLKENDNKEKKSSSSFNNKISNKKNNTEINNILREYNLLKELMNESTSFVDIKTKKLITYVDLFE